MEHVTCHSKVRVLVNMLSPVGSTCRQASPLGEKARGRVCHPIKATLSIIRPWMLWLTAF